MSSFVCSDLQFATLVKQVSAMPYSPVKPGEQQAVADLLKRENIRSVNYRYGQHNRMLPVGLDVSPQCLTITLTSLINVARCIEYQSCDRPDYEKSRANHMLMRILAFLLQELPEVKTRLRANDVWSI